MASEGRFLRALVCTVGQGHKADHQRTLVDPIVKSVQDGRWAHIVLLPSAATAVLADMVQKALPSEVAAATTVAALPADGAEEDFDACVTHFGRVVEVLLTQGIPPRGLVFDITRGTKVMSSALALVAVQYGAEELRYVTGTRGDAGVVMAGTERISRIRPRIVLARRRLDDATTLLRSNAYEAAFKLADEVQKDIPDVPDLARAAQETADLAAFYAAWDRLDHDGAAALGAKIEADPPRVSALAGLAPSGDVVKYLQSLAAVCQDDRDRVAADRRLAAELLVNAERRLQAGHFEDAIVRAYRVVELMAEVLLRTQSVAFDDADMDDRGGLMDRLRALNHPLGDRILRLFSGTGGGFGIRRRNRSLLIHGRDVFTADDREALQKKLDDLAELLQREQPSMAAANLGLARKGDVARLVSRRQGPARA